MFNNKKAQYMRMMRREQSSRERQERIVETKILMNEGHSAESIATILGVSASTIRGYIREINASSSHYSSLAASKEAKREAAAAEEARLLTRTPSEIYSEEIPKAIIKGLVFCGIALLWWWIPSIILYVFDAGDVTNWIYSWSGFIISTIVVSAIIATIRISKAMENRIILNQEQKAVFDNGKYRVNCTVCKRELKIPVEDLPKREETKEISCPSCSMKLQISIPEKFYTCNGCKKEHNTLKARLNHQEKCKEFKDRSISCEYCGLDMLLDDSEIKELKKKGFVNVKCNKCKKAITIKKKIK